MNKTDIDEQVRIVCRMRRLSIHTERTYADCESGDVISPLDALTQNKVVPFVGGRGEGEMWRQGERRTA